MAVGESTAISLLERVVAVACVAACSATHASKPPIADARPLPAMREPSPAACTSAEQLRVRATADAAAQRRLAALRALERAEALCPSQHSASEGLTRRLRTELGTALLAVASLARGSELLERAGSVRAQGEEARARLLEEQAVLVLERAVGSSLTARVPGNGASTAEAFWSNDSKWLLTRDHDGLTLRCRGEWYPRFVSEAGGNQGLGDKAALGPDGTLLLAPSSVFDDSHDFSRRATWFSARSVAPDESFGQERALLRVNLAAAGDYTPDGAHFVYAERADSPTDSGPDALVIADAKSFVVQQRVAPPAGSPRDERISHLVLGRGGTFALVQWSHAGLSLVRLETGETTPIEGPTIALPGNPFSPDERFAVFAGGEAVFPYSVRIFDTQSHAVRKFSDPDCDITTRVAFDPASRWIALGSSSAVCVIELATGAVLRKLRAPGRKPSLLLPDRFTSDGSGLLVTDVGRLWLFATASWRPVPLHGEPFGALRNHDGQLVLVAHDGLLTFLGPKLSRRELRPSGGLGSELVGAVGLGAEIALKLETEWLFVHARSGAVRHLPLPAPGDTQASPDGELVVRSAGRTPEIFSIREGQRDPASPLALESFDSVFVEDGALVLRSKTRERRWSKDGELQIVHRAEGESKSRCGWAAHSDPTGRFSLVDKPSQQDPRLVSVCDGWSGLSGPSFTNAPPGRDSATISPDGARVAFGPFEISLYRAERGVVELSPIQGLARRFVSKSRLLVSGPTPGRLVVWDLMRNIALGYVPLTDEQTQALALSPDDRYVLVGQELWELRSQQRIAKLAEPVQAAEFWGPNLLATVSGPRLTLYRTPGLTPVVALLGARDSDASIAFQLEPDSSAEGTRVTALQSFGVTEAWDSSLTCSVGRFGVPFRICRELLGGAVTLGVGRSQLAP